MWRGISDRLLLIINQKSFFLIYFEIVKENNQEDYQRIEIVAGKGDYQEAKSSIGGGCFSVLLCT